MTACCPNRVYAAELFIITENTYIFFLLKEFLYYNKMIIFFGISTINSIENKYRIKIEASKPFKVKLLIFQCIKKIILILVYLIAALVS